MEGHWDLDILSARQIGLATAVSACANEIASTVAAIGQKLSVEERAWKAVEYAGLMKGPGRVGSTVPSGQRNILGAGMTGLAAARTSGLPVYEASDHPGGICSSYYVQPGDRTRLYAEPSHAEAFRFEIGGGHWLFGGQPEIVGFLHSLTRVSSYTRRAAVRPTGSNGLVPYPIQNHLSFLDAQIRHAALTEMVPARQLVQTETTLREWLRESFGPTLCRLFFDPFHDHYTAGLWMTIAPQDSYKSPTRDPRSAGQIAGSGLQCPIPLSCRRSRLPGAKHGQLVRDPFRQAGGRDQHR